VARYTADLHHYEIRSDVSVHQLFLSLISRADSLGDSLTPAPAQSMSLAHQESYGQGRPGNPQRLWRFTVPAVPAVLVVDDDPDTRGLLSAILSTRGYDVTLSADAQDAEDRLVAGAFDAIVLDNRMPGVSGVSLCRQLRARPHTAALPIMLVSADVFASDVAAGMAAGADDYVIKPFHRADLLARLDAILNRRGINAARAAHLATVRAVAAAGPINYYEPAAAAS
jgi:CheY-like chemotaxis protein